MVLAWCWNRRHLYRHSRKVPGPHGLPLLGNLFDFTGTPSEIYDKTTKYFETYPNLAKLWFGPKLVYGVSKPEYLEKIFSSLTSFDKEESYRKFGGAFLGDGLLTASLPTWKRHRKIILPIFNQKVLNSFVEIFAKHFQFLNDELEKHVGREFDLYELLTRCTLDITCETIMGVEVGTQKGELFLFKRLDRILEITYLRQYSIWYHLDFMFKWTQLHKENVRLIGELNRFTEELINKKRVQVSTGCTPNRKSLLDLLLESSAEKLTTDEIKDEMQTFIIAASDTTAVTACFILVMLGMHPQIQNRVLEETNLILGPDGQLEYQDIPRFEYTSRVIKETVRLFPPGPYVARHIQADLPLEENLVLPKGASVLLGLIHVQRSTEFWKDPLKFDPDRFLPKEVEKIYPHSYVPFATGPRTCVGKKYAMMSLTTMVATVVRKFKIGTEYKSVDEIKLKTNMVIRPQDGFKVWLELRK
ncbi:cytochrome P450 4C1-like [Zophobas morio]|uniref:cytochrome P450 4C1-like n=1 Tax=Zophobas morio TaxID=2755281 RepID=UPI0030828203